MDACISMQACLSMGDGSYKPKVTILIVHKRHHTRLYASNPHQADRSGNILPGTVVDGDICHPYEYDFFMNSHAGIQGTSRPAHYHVVVDENGFSQDFLQLLTYRCVVSCMYVHVSTNTSSVCWSFTAARNTDLL